MIEANNPSLTSWIEVEKNSDFPIQNLPFGIASTTGKSARVFVRIGNQALDLSALADRGFLSDLNFDLSVFSASVLNPFIELGKIVTQQTRNSISKLLRSDNTKLKDYADLSTILYPVSDLEMKMPVNIGDYTDFYSSEQHAYNVGCMFRDPNNALLPNWKHIPVGYHGRSSSIVLSGTDIHRPLGQSKPADAETPVFGPSKLLDFELEMAFITYPGKPLGQRISTEEADNYIFGMVLFNDWSARDIQAWEYVPLGPFLAKNFASSISPWVVTLDALTPFQVPGPIQNPEVFPYLKYSGNKHIDIDLEVFISPLNGTETQISRSNYRHMYWNMNQQLAHHTVNGCNIRGGDMIASGTISGNDESAYGSMLEISWRGSKSVKLNDGAERKFIQDFDTVIMRGHSEKNGVRVGFGEVVTKVLPALA
jgi:fumarylacetoacetase